MVGGIMTHYQLYGKKKDRSRFIENLDVDELQKFGEKSSRSIMYHYNYDLLDSTKTTRINHNTQTRDLMIPMRRPSKKGRAE